MKYIKDGVKASDVKLQVIDALLIMQLVLQRFNYDLVVTSLSDSKHKDTSLHYRGYAVDIRTRDMKVQEVPTVVRECRIALGKAYDVVQESDHIHVEYDPDHNGGLTLP